MIFSWRPGVCVCVRFLTLQTPITHKRLEISNFNFVRQWSSHALKSWRFSYKLMPYLKFYGIFNSSKNVRGSYNFRKIWAIVLKLHPNIIYRSRIIGIEFGQNRFLRFWSQNCPTPANFNLSSWNFVRKCTDTEWCLILNFGRIGQAFNFKRVWIY